MKTCLRHSPELTSGRAISIRNEIWKRRRCRSRNLSKNCGDSKMLDLVIIGAGPAGISAAYEAKKAGLDYLVIEKGLIGNTIYNYPVGLTVFSTTNELE